MITLFLLMAAAPARGIEIVKPVEVAPVAGIAMPALPQAEALPTASVALPGAAALQMAAPEQASPISAQAAQPEASAPQAQVPAEAARAQVDRFWEGAGDVVAKGKVGPQLPYWKAAFDENARIVESRSRFLNVPGLLSVSHVSTRNHQGVPTPGLQLVLGPKADMASVLADMARIEPAIKNYRLIPSETPGERRAVYLVRPSRTGHYRDPKESAALAQERREEARFNDTLHIASGHDAPVDYGRQENHLVREYIEKPEVFDSRAQFLRYVVLDEKPEGMLTDPESISHYLAAAIKNGSRRFWSGAIGQETQKVGFFFQKRDLVVALSPETPLDLAQPASVYGLKTELKAYNVKEGKTKRFASLREPMRWVSGMAGLGISGALGFGAIPAVVLALRHLYAVSGGAFFAAFVLSLFLAPYLLMGFKDALSWTIRVVRLYRAIPR